MHYPYDAFLNGTGLTIRPFQIQWYTTALNRLTIKWAHSYPKFFTRSFDLGVLISIILLPLALIWQIMPIIADLLWYGDNIATKGSTGRPAADLSDSKARVVQFELMLPGINLPFNEIGYFTIAMGVCSIIHEFGHALAAVLEDVPVLGFGFNIMVLIPFAYTHLSSDQLNSLRPWRRLRVLCAGVWHNLLLAGVAFAIMSLLPFLISPFYSIDQGVIITNMKPKSPLAGVEKGLITDDVITAINDCKITNMNTWYSCLLQAKRHPPAYCIPSDYVLDHDESVPVFHTNDGVTECCDKSNVKSMCFEFVNEDGSYSLIELPQHMCLNVRKTVENSLAYCHRTQGKCTDSYCIKPMMNNATTLMQIKRVDKSDVLYIGHPADLVYTISVSKFVPQTTLLSASFADGCFLFLKYLIAFSLGLGILNLIPCLYFDGYHITNTAVNHFLQKFVPERSRREFIAIVINSVGTLALIITLLRSLWHSFKLYK